MASASSNIRALNRNRASSEEVSGNVVKIDSASGMKTPISKDASVDQFAEQIGGEVPDKWGGRKPKNLTITPEKAIERWENGLWNDYHFVLTAIEMEGSTEDFNVENFIFKWRGSPDENGKAKELKPATVKKALNDIERKGGVGIKHGPIQLTIKF